MAVRGERGAGEQGALTQLGIAELGRDQLEREPGAGVTRGLVRGLLEQHARGADVVAMVNQVAALVEQGARALFGAVGDADQAFQEAPQVFVLVAGDDGDQPLERLPELGLGVHGTELVAHARGLFADAFFEHPDFVQQDRAGAVAARGVVLGAQAGDGRRDDRQVLRRRRDLGVWQATAGRHGIRRNHPDFRRPPQGCLVLRLTIAWPLRPPDRQ